MVTQTLLPCYSGSVKTKTKANHGKGTLLLPQLLFAVLFFFLAPCSYGFVAHRFRNCNHPIAKVSVPARRRKMSSSGIGATNGEEETFTASGDTDTQTTTKKSKIPIHLLAGFLGSGKTTTLKHVLENKEDIRVGVIVNDVASVNIDAKLIARARRGREKKTKSKNELDKAGVVVELQNGCACCSLAGELFDSIESLLPQNNDASSSVPAYDAILVELSGVADPLAIRNNWREAVKLQTNPLVTESSELGNVVTIVDATTFGSDYMTFDILRDRDGWFDDDDTGTENNKNKSEPHSVNRQVVELLAEQVEAADLIVINKEDLAGLEKVKVAKSMAEIMNKDARVFVTSKGRIPAIELLGLSQSSRDGDGECTESSHSHSHDHNPSEDAAIGDGDCAKEPLDSHNPSHDHSSSKCDDVDCKDPSHDYSSSKCEDADCEDPSHDHSSSKCDGADCTDPSHDHSSSKCDDVDCTDPSHDHSSSKCDDVDCTDPSHDHSHSHDHGPMTSMANLGISSFVYRATRPFQANRLMKLIFDWPIPIKEELDFALLKDVVKTGYGIDDREEQDRPAKTTEREPHQRSDKSESEIESESELPITSPFVGVLRSKGFCWIAPTAWEGLLADTWRHDTTMYWSHAGKHVGIQTGGLFWDSLPRSAMEEFFAPTNQHAEIERILREDFVTEEFGDRRQELVFIGASLRQHEIEAALDSCLLTDTEMEDYRKQLVLLRD